MCIIPVKFWYPLTKLKLVLCKQKVLLAICGIFFIYNLYIMLNHKEENEKAQLLQVRLDKV